MRTIIEYRAIILSVEEELVKNPPIDAVLDEKPLIVLGEIHKYKELKNYLKGFIDEYKNDIARNFIFLYTLWRHLMTVSSTQHDSEDSVLLISQPCVQVDLNYSFVVRFLLLQPPIFFQYR